jgi:hypothetical protein
MIEGSIYEFGYLDFVNTLITLAIMLPIFYFLYRKLWCQKARESDRGSGLVRFIRRMDRGKPFINPAKAVAFVVLFTAVFCLLMIPLGFAFGTTEPEKMKDRRIDPIIEPVYFNYTFDESGMAQEGTPIDYTFEPAEGNTIFAEVHFTWEDEPDESGLIMQYDNQPDTFRISLLSPSGEELQSGTNDQGMITLSWNINDENAMNGTFTFHVELVNAGDQEPPLNFMQPIADDSNAFSFSVDYESVDYVLVEEDDYHIRW